jgi:uncharacterized protein YaaQ
MWFATYLYRRGLVSAEQIIEASIRQSDRRIPLGRLALECKKLSIHQVAKILDAQIEEGQRFGQLAIRMGFLSERDVAYLLMVQNDRLPALRQILVEMRALDPATMEVEFKNAQRAAVANDELLMVVPFQAQTGPADWNSPAR